MRRDACSVSFSPDHSQAKTFPRAAALLGPHRQNQTTVIGSDLQLASAEGLGAAPPRVQNHLGVRRKQLGNLCECGFEARRCVQVVQALVCPPSL